MSSPLFLAAIGGLILGLILFYFTIKEATLLLRAYVQSFIGKPVLVKETSSGNTITQYIVSFLQLFYSKKALQAISMKDIESTFKDVILDEDGKDRVVSIAIATRNTKRTDAPYRHMLLHGPPG